MPGKRTITIVCGALTLALAAAACGGAGGGGEQGGKTGSAQPIKVGLVTDINQLNDRGFNHLAYVGLKRAERELGVEGRVLESKSAADYVPNMSRLALDGYDLVIGVGYAQGDAIAKAAKRFPGTRFAIIDVDQKDLPNRPPNVVGLLFREQEAGYLAGYLAGLVEQDAGKPVLGSVGGMKEPPVDRFIAGYQAGAHRANPRARLLNGYSQDWDAQDKCKELALHEIARGAQVVFQVAGGCGLGALDAAKEQQVWGIGVDADQSFLGPFVLTSAVKRVDQAVFLTIESIKNGTWRGGRSVVYGLKQGGVGLGKISPRVPKSTVAKVRKVEQAVAAGKVAIPTSL